MPHVLLSLWSNDVWRPNTGTVAVQWHQTALAHSRWHLGSLQQTTMMSLTASRSSSRTRTRSRSRTGTRISSGIEHREQEPSLFTSLFQKLKSKTQQHYRLGWKSKPVLQSLVCFYPEEKMLRFYSTKSRSVLAQTQLKVSKKKKKKKRKTSK